MRVPVSWLREYASIPADATARDIAQRLISAGLEVETVDEAGADVKGPLVVGRVLDFTEETHKNGKTIRWCSVDVGSRNSGGGSDARAAVSDGRPRGIVCGARNFDAGDLVVVALPGAELTGGFVISARKTYGHVSDGMICSTLELGLGDDHTGILILGTDEGEPGADAIDVLSLREDVLDIAVTPDRGYALSVRGIAREAATAYDVPYVDPAGPGDREDLGTPDDSGYPVRLADTDRCPVFVARSLSGFDPSASTPRWMQRRLQLAGMRPLSLAIDVTNYAMLELGNPIHGYDRTLLSGPIVVRRAEPGEKLTTLDDVVRDLDPDDLLITDDTGPIGLAGVMGGATTELAPTTTSIVIEAAHFEATGIARTARRHRLATEGAKRWERGVDPQLPSAAAKRVVQLLAELGGGSEDPGVTVAGEAPETSPIEIAAGLPARVVGVNYPADEVERALRAVGASVVADGERLTVTPPSWRPDLTDPYDLVEEVARLHGYDAIPAVLPQAPIGRGLTFTQRLRRGIERAIASAGYVEAPSYPFVGVAEFDALGLPPDDRRRIAVRLANPISDQEPLLRTTLLPGLLATLRRNVSRGTKDVALFESGLVFRPDLEGHSAPPRLAVDRRPTDEEIASLEAALPEQPQRLAVVLAGDREPAGWWGPARPASWADAIEAARTAADVARIGLRVEQDDHAPWHPGRCAALYVGDVLVGHAGELHPRVIAEYELPLRTSAMEIDLNLLGAGEEPVPAPSVSTYPVATQDIALVVDTSVPAAAVEDALRDGAGHLLESLRLFDVYEGVQVGEGRKSLAYALRFRAPDRTLTVEETTAARDAAVNVAAERTGAQLRS